MTVGKYLGNGGVVSRPGICFAVPRKRAWAHPILAPITTRPSQLIRDVDEEEVVEEEDVGVEV